MAAKAGHTDVVKVLLEHGATPDRVDYVSERAPRSMKSFDGHSLILLSLLTCCEVHLSSLTSLYKQNSLICFVNEFDSYGSYYLAVWLDAVAMGMFQRKRGDGRGTTREER